MATIRATPEILRERAEVLERCADEFRKNLHIAQELSRSVLREWEGETMDYYYSRIQELTPECDKMADVLQETAEGLRNTASALESCEQSAASIIIKGIFG